MLKRARHKNFYIYHLTNAYDLHLTYIKFDSVVPIVKLKALKILASTRVRDSKGHQVSKVFKTSSTLQLHVLAV